ncbi:hypothetical protein ACFSHT_33600 [Paraburkholderia silviterrae]|uniref:SnoaL-like protein n=1 Tax=Paraburkholderia silviterrae TaxID=2528715 RepID=A0A4R5M2S9_9BURK|nr:hypothetical protein [Paraburkholderia silviterrae]TDG19808.1 hypothetical protein EYW47_28465 [Paraburkholderia silviterrae]
MTRPGSLFLPQQDDPGDDASKVRLALAVLDAFTAAFNARDIAGMDAQLHFPHVILSGEQLVLWETPGQLPPHFFDDLARETGWHHSAWHAREPVLVGPRKVHFAVTWSRNRTDGSIVTLHHNLWIATEEAGRWGIKQRSY